MEAYLRIYLHLGRSVVYFNRREHWRLTEMCDDDTEDAERDISTSMAQGKCHEVTVDVTIRLKLMVPGAFHDPFELEDLVSEHDLGEGDIQNVEEVV